MVRYTDMDMTIIKEEVYTPRALETEGVSVMQGHMRKHQNKSGDRGRREQSMTQKERHRCSENNTNMSDAFKS